MAAESSVKVVDEGVTRALERLRLGLPLGGGMRPAMQQVARALVTGAQMRFRSQITPQGQPWTKSHRAIAEGGQTLSNTRRLRNSITGDATPTTATAGTNVVYAAIHQFGGIIRAKAGPFLSLPLTDAACKAGSPRNMPGLHVMQTLKGQYLLVDASGTAQYLLRHQVKIPARPYLGVSAADAAEIIRIADQHLQQRWLG